MRCRTQVCTSIASARHALHVHSPLDSFTYTVLLIVPESDRETDRQTDRQIRQTGRQTVEADKKKTTAVSPNRKPKRHPINQRRSKPFQNRTRFFFYFFIFGGGTNYLELVRDNIRSGTGIERFKTTKTTRATTAASVFREEFCV